MTGFAPIQAPAQRIPINLNPIHDKPKKKNHAGFTPLT